MAATDATIIFQAHSVTLKYDLMFSLLKTGSCACIVVLYMSYQNMALLYHSILRKSGEEQHAPVKIISEVHRWFTTMAAVLVAPPANERYYVES